MIERRRESHANASFHAVVIPLVRRKEGMFPENFEGVEREEVVDELPVKKDEKREREGETA